MQERGFTLVEVLVAMGVLSTAALGTAQLVSVATRAMHFARVQQATASAASTRLDQLRGLDFAFGPDGLRITDVVTNLSVDPPAPGGGGLTPGGAATLQVNTPGFVDYLDASGRWVGAGAAPPAAAVFVRRWAVEPLGSPDLLILQVLVRPVSETAAGSGSGPGTARLATAIARVQR